ncbi:MAG TPA: nodulation protein NfeD [Thermomicrobiales bacterium]|nr:nodulation protein NfeD [Thermomicrobiales bacterium]
MLCLLLGTLLALASPAIAQQSQPRVEVIQIDGTITPVMAQYVDRGIKKAEHDNAAAVVLEIDTPGGLSSAMDDIVDDILQSEVPVIAYVSPQNARAASAGVYITYATHIAAMAPGTNIGSASPVQIGNEDSNGQSTMERKVMNDAIARIENLAKLRGRNVDWAISAVRDAANITADEALSLGVIDLIAPDLDTLLTDVDGMQVPLANGETVTLSTAGARTSTIHMNGIEQFLQLISDPTIAYLLLSFGSLGIFLELANPGGYVPGVVGLICFILGFYALGTLPVNWTGVLLIGFAFLLFFIDLFVSSYGLLLTGGLISFIVGSYLLIDTNVPGYSEVSRPIIWTAASLIVAGAAAIGFFVVRSMRRRPATGKPAILGQVGVVRTELNPTGFVFLEGELWTATAEGLPAGGSLPAGTNVEVTAIDGLRLTVRKTTTPVVDEVRNTPRQESIVPVSTIMEEGRRPARS